MIRTTLSQLKPLPKPFPHLHLHLPSLPFSTKSHTSKLALGGSKAFRLDLSQYSSIISTAYQNGITTFESGHKGEESLSKAFNMAREHMDSEEGITLTARFGYRSDDNREEEDEKGEKEVRTFPSFPKDVCLTNDNHDGSRSPKAYHNLSHEYVAHCIETSPLLQFQSCPSIEVVYMAHNPETQGGALHPDASREERREVVSSRLVDAFKGLEEACSNGSISNYGVCSNGLSLPEDHVLGLDWRDVLGAACRAANEIHGKPTMPKLSILQLPGNLLETNGLAVSKAIRSHLSSSSITTDDNTTTTDPTQILPTSLSTFLTRPLTSYPDLGTSTSPTTPTHPFKLIDYQIPLDLTDSTQTRSSHLLPNIPPFYQSIINLTKQHFDANQILESQKERELTPEEKDTLEGCKLIQSMIHDLDSLLETLNSFSWYEENLYAKVIPLIYDTFDGLDEESGAVLQAFFSAHGSAARHAIAKHTRSLLQKGSDTVPPYEIPDDVTLQEFALQFLLKQSSVDKVVVGCPQPQHVLEMVRAAEGLNGGSGGGHV